MATGGGERGDEAFFEMIRTHRARTFFKLMGRLPRAPRCVVCRAPFGGAGGKLMRRFGFGPSRKNPRLCAQCFEKGPDGGVELDVGVLFADVRGFTSLAERRDPHALVGVLNAFYDAAVDVLCHHAIIDKLVGDQVMALYLPQILGDAAVQHMVEDALAFLAAAPDELSIGVGLDYGTAFVGNVGSREVKDFTAIGDVVNTAARLQAAAGSGEVILSHRVVDLNPTALRDAEARSMTLKGKLEPERAFVVKLHCSPYPPST
jgi:adenylate cyclase